MSSVKTWIQNLVVAGLVGLGLLVTAILGLFAYMTSTAVPFHPDPAEVTSVTTMDPSPRWTDSVERGRQIMREGVTEQNLPGASVAVGVGGEIVWAEGFGWTDLDTREKFTPDTLIKLGMGSKVLTSAGVGLLLEQGRLKLDDEIQTYVPEFPRKEWPVTLRQLMGHLAGVRTDGGDEGPLREHCEETTEGLRLFASRSLLFEPGTGYRYSNYGWILVSAAVESAADERFFRFMRTHVFEPLGMEKTAVDRATESVPDRAAFYFPRFAADPRYGHDGARTVDYSCFAGSGAFASTPSDLVRFGMAVNGGRLLQPATVEMLQTPQRLASGEETGYGLGWDLEAAELAGAPTTVVGHDGDWMGGRIVSLLTFPERGIVVAVASNIAWTDTFALGLGVAGAFAEQMKGQTP